VIKPDRPLVRQNFFPFAVATNVAAVALASIAQQSSITSLYTAIAFSVPIGGLSVIWGDSSVLAANGNGIWISPGVVQVWPINNGRQLYEIQEPLVDGLPCANRPLAIPFSVWDLSTIWVASTGAQTLGVILFQESFV